jgi:hypothetical protein
MVKITESDFERLCCGIAEDRDKIIKHNPIGPDGEVLLWMLLSVLNSYLSLSEIEMPCFTGRPDEKTFRDAIIYVLRGRMDGEFDPEPHLDRLVSA